jgi:hypothetical protein
MAPIGRIFGYREVPGQTSIQRMFNEIGKPQWRTDIKSFIPEVRNDINKYIVNILENEAEKTINSLGWKNGDTMIRTKMLSDVLSRSKTTTMDILKDSSDPTDTRTLKFYELTNGTRGISKNDVDKALVSLKIDKEITELDENQLDFLITYLELKKDDEKQRIKDSR